MTSQACLGASKKQLGADKFGDVVKTGSSTALAAVTLWNQVPGVASFCCQRAFLLVAMLLCIARMPDFPQTGYSFHSGKKSDREECLVREMPILYAAERADLHWPPLI